MKTAPIKPTVQSLIFGNYQNGRALPAASALEAMRDIENARLALLTEAAKYSAACMPSPSKRAGYLRRIAAQLGTLPTKVQP